MFFTRRRWAIRVIENLNIPMTDVKASELIDMLIQGSKQINLAGGAISKPEQILIAAAAIVENQSAINRFIVDLGCSYKETVTLFEQIKSSAKLLASKHSYDNLIDSSWFK